MVLLLTICIGVHDTQHTHKRVLFKVEGGDGEGSTNLQLKGGEIMSLQIFIDTQDPLKLRDGEGRGNGGVFVLWFVLCLQF